MALQDEDAIVLLSGGQDSAASLAWALTCFRSVETIAFDYGQRHRAELDCRMALRDGMAAIWPGKLGEDHLLDLSLLGRISDTALTREAEIALGEDGLPTTFVPGRNLIFFNLAAAIGYRRGIRHLVGGMCETDYSGYPDCRDDTLKALQVALSLGLDRRIVLHMPLMWLDKAETWALSEKLGGPELVELIRRESHSCYLGDRGELHDWGYGCGACPACDLRAKGWRAYATIGDTFV